MVDHTLKVDMQVKADVAVGGDPRQRQLDARVVELLAEAIAEGATYHERIESAKLARAIFKGVAALPRAIAQARQELGM